MSLRSIISLITFPGVMMHEWAHKKFCNWTGVYVQKVAYFRFGETAGYVEHNTPDTYTQTFWIATGPLLINTLFTYGLAIISSHFEPLSTPHLIFLWLALSIGMHAFPSNHDMSHISSHTSILRYFALPLVWIIKTANHLRIFWIDAIYAILIISLGGGFNWLYLYIQDLVF
ncbi:MAG: metalloprotease family protein [Candidatus Pacebacteria bacterium]|nr:metalloprotease family protein [Candidatus Paceibacterota bacterium]MCF7862858.1 metalloprotease family protein [Candidatus Paceibacterota bacterium]